MENEQQKALAVGDRVRRRQFPHTQGNVWSIERGMVIVKWDDREENAYVRDDRDLEKITPPRTKR
jgi:hypothetical protein